MSGVAMTKPRRRRRPIRKRTVALLMFGAVLASLLGTWLRVNYLAGRKLRDAEAEADRLDPGWRLADLVAKRQVVPDAENSAFRVARVVRFIPPRWPPETKRAAGFFAPPGSSAYLAETVTDRVEKLAPEERLDDALASAIRRDLRAMAPAVAEARALAGLDRGRTDLAWAKVVHMTLLGHVQNTRRIAHLLAADSALRAHDGDLDGALDSCRAAIASGRSIGDEPSAISQIVRMAITRQAMNAAERVLAQGEASDAALAKFQALLLDEAGQPLLLWGLRGERAMNDDTFGRLAAGEHSPAEVNMAITDSGVDRTTEALATASAAYVRYNHALSLESLNRAVEIAKRPTPEQIDLWDAWQESIAPPEESLRKLAGSMSAAAAGPGVRPVARSYVQTLAQLHAMTTLLAAERQRLKHGVLPSRVDAIDPSLLPRALSDPYTGRAIVLKPEGGGLIAYSTSVDRKDDGGVHLSLKQHDRPGHDLGFRLRAVADRGRPPRFDVLPDDVFRQDTPARGDEAASP